MPDAFVSVNGHAVTRVQLSVPYEGPWFADVAYTDEGERAASGAVDIAIGATTLRGTVDHFASGTFGLQRMSRIVAGGNGWSKLVRGRGYTNDAGVKALGVIRDAAGEVGETIGSATPAAERLGTYYLRPAGPASRVIEAAARGAKWWVGYDGVTNVGERAGTPAAPGTYEVLNFNPRTAEAVLALDEINAVLPGMMISERLDAPLIVRSLEITIEAPGSLRAIAWCGTGRAEQGADLMREIVNRIVSPQRFGKRRYRVVNMAGDRVDLQIVRKASGWPDLASVAMWAGVAGVHADLTPGAEVLVELVEGDEAQPVIVGFVGRGGQGHVAEHVTIGAADSDDAMPAARQGDTVRVLLPPMVFTGTIGGSPATGVLSAMTGSTLGTIETGSPKVGIGPGP